MSSIYTATKDERGDLIAKAKKALLAQGRVVSPTNLAAELGCAESTVQRWLEELEDDRRGMRTRQAPAARKALILASALIVAERDGFGNMTRKAIAAEAYVSEPLVNKYLGTLPQLRRTVMRQAVKHAVLPIIAQGLAAKNRYALAANEELKTKALESLKG